MVESIHERVLRAAERTPEATAFRGADGAATYAQLEDRANRLANVLGEMGCRPGDRVAIDLPRSSGQVVAILAILKTGCSYVPLASCRGVVWRAATLRRTEPRVVLFAEGPGTAACAGQGGLPAVLDDLRVRSALNGARVGWLGTATDEPRVDFTDIDVATAPGRHPVGTGRPDLPLAVLCRRGQRSAPHPVQITHASLATFLDWAVPYFDLGPGSRVSWDHDAAFAPALLDIFGPLTAGATLHPVPPEVADAPTRIARWIGETRLTLWHSVPSKLDRVARAGALESLAPSSLRHVAWSGDVLPTPSLLRWKRHLPGTVFTNLYGLAEGGGASSYYRVPETLDDPDFEIPIGSGCRGHQLLVLDDELRPVRAGEVGTIYVRGEGICTSGRQRGEPVESRTVEGNGLGRLYRTGDLGTPGEDGAVRLVGREADGLDRGATTPSPSAVENVILQLDEVAACAVVPVPDGDASPTPWACAYVPSNGRPLRVSAAMERLRKKLPGHRIPSRWLVLEELPLDPRGRVDRGLARALLGG